MTKQEQNFDILVVENSFPVRKLMIENLNKKGVETIEAVDAADTLRVMGEQTPNSLLLCNLGKTSAIVFARALGKQKKTYNLATVLIIRDPQMFEEIQKEPLHNSVVPIPKYDSIDALTESIMTAYKIASINSESVVVDEQDIQSYASSSEAKQQKIKVEKLNHAYENFRKVVELVRSDQLPGPMMPGMLMEVRKLLSDPEVEFEKVAKFTLTHQALSAKIMSLANSVYYSRGKRATTIKQAIVRLGLEEVSNILNAVAALEYIVGKNRQLRDLTALSLSKGYLVGLIGEFLGRITESSKINEIYTAGLFHNIGSTFMLYTLSLLHDKGEIEEVDTDALTTMIANRAGKLNEMISKALLFPPEINFIYLDASSEDLLNTEESYSIRNYINQAIWTAEQILDNREGILTCTTEAELLGLNEDIIDHLNEKFPDLLDLLKQYEQLG
jgi:response regulator RpfG family c-di-GMP phosphodiesterase